jgi:hypothetical protein
LFRDGAGRRFGIGRSHRRETELLFGTERSFSPRSVIWPISPPSIKSDWEWYRDAYRRSPACFSGDIPPEAEERFGRMIQHLDASCDLGILDE